jgi:hypothetical protein
VKKYTYTESKDTRSGFGAGLLEAGRKKTTKLLLFGTLIWLIKMGDLLKNFQIDLHTSYCRSQYIGIAASLTIGKIPFTGARISQQEEFMIKYANLVPTLVKQKCENLCFSCWLNFR